MTNRLFKRSLQIYSLTLYNRKDVTNGKILEDVKDRKGEIY